MSNGTDGDEPGQRSGDGRQSPPEPGSGPSSDPVWPVWGGAGTPAGPDLSEPESASDESATSTVDDDPATDAVESGTAAEPGAVAPAEPVADSETDADPEAGSDAASPADAEPTADDETEVDPEPEAVSEVEADAAPDDEAKPEADLDPAVDAPVGESDGVVSPPADAADDAAESGVDATRQDDEPADETDAADDPVQSGEETTEPAAADEVAATAVDADGDDDSGPTSPVDAAPESEVVAGATPEAEESADDASASKAAAAAVVAASAATSSVPAAKVGTEKSADATSSVAAEPASESTSPESTNGRDAATAVIAPVAAATAASTAAASTAAASAAAKPGAPAPVGTLAAPVTRTIPSSATAATATVPTTTAAATPDASAPVAAAAAASAAAKPAAPPAAPTRVSAGPVAGAAAAGAAATTPPKAPIPSGPVPPSARKESPLDVFEAEDGKRRWPKRLLIALGVVVVLAAAYVGVSYGLADRVPRGATVAGVDIGGLTSQEAVARLDEELSDATTQPIEVVANDVQATIDPVAAGLTFDAQATVDQLTGVELVEPMRLWKHLVGVGEQEPVTSVDDEALAAALSDLGTSLALAPVDGTIVFVDATAQSTDAVDGWDLDQDGAADVLSEDWLVAARPIELPTMTVAPDITQDETDAALVEAQKVTSAPVSVVVSDQIALLDTATLAANASYVPTDGNLVLQMNGQGLTDAVLAQLPDLLTASADAHFEFVNDAPVIVPGTPGTSLDPAAVATSVSTAATSSDRTAHVELVEADPAQSTAELEALGVKEIVSEFSTPLTSEPRRTVNITNGASKISGTLIRPDETFSLTDALGPIDAAHGFVEAGAIVSGEHTDAWGGGLSQISTTTYNAGFLAGFEDIEHRPHSEWFARYPEGREATIFTGTLDMRWKNNSPYGALVQAWVSGGRVYVRIWGTKYWTVESITSPRSGVVAPTTVYSQSPTCEASAAGNPGFSVTVTRKTSLNGELKKTESNSWRYKPQNKIICGPAPTPTPPPTP